MLTYGKYYYEKKENPKFYLIFTNEGFKAGNYYNEFILKFLLKIYIKI